MRSIGIVLAPAALAACLGLSAAPGAGAPPPRPHPDTFGADSLLAPDLESEDASYIRPSRVVLGDWWNRPGWGPGLELARELTRNVPQLSRLVSGDPEDPRGHDANEIREAILALLRQSRSGPPGLRPWFLLAADGLTARYAAHLDGFPPDDTTRIQQVLGSDTLRFEYDTLAVRWISAHDLLWRLWREHGATPAGERAFVILSDLGWDTTCCCEVPDAFRRVSARAEKFLEERPNSEVAAEVHLLAARAYETWWSLASFEDPEAGYTLEWPSREAEAGPARDHAVSHYTWVASHAGVGSSEAKYAARHLPPIRAGIDTRQRAFFCVYE